MLEFHIESLEEVNVTSLQRSEFMDRENADLRSKIIILETTNVKLSKDNGSILFDFQI